MKSNIKDFVEDLNSLCKKHKVNMIQDFKRKRLLLVEEDKVNLVDDVKLQKDGIDYYVSL